MARPFQRLHQHRYFPYIHFGLTILGWVPVAVYVSRHVYGLAQVGGESMQPTFNPNLHTSLHHDVLLLEKWRGRYRRGDVVTLWCPSSPELLTTKRIVALEGDVVSTLPPHHPKVIKVPPGHVWVEGDSAYRTRDSNTYGPVSLSLVDSRVTHILWPFKRFSEVTRGPGKSEGRVKRLGPDWVDSH